MMRFNVLALAATLLLSGCGADYDQANYGALLATGFLNGYNSARPSPPITTLCSPPPIPGASISCTSF